MALLRLPHFPSTTFFHSEPQHQQQSQKHKVSLFTSLSSSLQKSHLLSTTHSKNDTNSSFFRTQKRISKSLLLSNFSSSTSQEQQTLDISLPNASPSKIETEEEVFSQIRLLAQNVPWSSTPEDIRALFEKYGTVLDVELSMYNKSRNRGLAFVTMGSPEEALAALTNLESFELEGRVLKINYAKEKKKKPASPPVQPKPVTFNLFVANLSYEARAKDLKEFFDSGSSSVDSAQIIFHENPRRSLGYGFVAFKSKKDAEASLVDFQGKSFMGRPIRVARSKQFVKQPMEEKSESEVISSESGLEQEDGANEN